MVCFTASSASPHCQLHPFVQSKTIVEEKQKTMNLRTYPLSPNAKVGLLNLFFLVSLVSWPPPQTQSRSPIFFVESRSPIFGGFFPTTQNRSPKMGICLFFLVFCGDVVSQEFEYIMCAALCGYTQTLGTPIANKWS